MAAENHRWATVANPEASMGCRSAPSLLWRHALRPVLDGAKNEASLCEPPSTGVWGETERSCRAMTAALVGVDAGWTSHEPLINHGSLIVLLFIATPTFKQPLFSACLPHLVASAMGREKRPASGAEEERAPVRRRLVEQG